MRARAHARARERAFGTNASAKDDGEPYRKASEEKSLHSTAGQHDSNIMTDSSQNLSWRTSDPGLRSDWGDTDGTNERRSRGPPPGDRVPTWSGWIRLDDGLAEGVGESGRLVWNARLPPGRGPNVEAEEPSGLRGDDFGAANPAWEVNLVGLS